MTTREAVDNMIRVLLYSGQRVDSNNWQATEAPGSMLEVSGLYVNMSMEGSRLEYASLAEATGADLPWAEHHFQERIGGKPTNPGETYKSWPYCPDFADYLDEDGKFSHTYQERFWPEKKNRWGPGNWMDIKDRLAKDLTTRQAFLSIWHPEDQSNNDVRVPCTIGYWFRLREVKGDCAFHLDITYLIRSCDALRHLRNDVYMAQRLAQDMMDHLHSKEIFVVPGTMSMWIGSLHCFENDRYALRKRLERP